MALKSDKQQNQYTVLECPECGEQYIVSPRGNLPSEAATLFSDGFFIENDDSNWRTPLIIGCVTCELGFMPQAGKVIAKGSLYELLEKYPGIKKATPPTAGALVLDLRARTKISESEEIAIRRELWYAALHTEKGRALLQCNKKFVAFFHQNLMRLINRVSDTLLQAEIYRQTGAFDQCLDLLQNDSETMAKQIGQQANAKNSMVFQIE
ncbi:MAG: hypothetical protein JXR50_13200 [Prolixibacteraceae bacterium]|nr:hypothetical protein [Prolixibacteraceae bacterium]MBN2650693.1 hypothetical protein [Prolixibacteraceae bacterium]